MRRLLRDLRVGASWSAKGGLTTVVETGTGPEDEQGRRRNDRLLGVLLTPELARALCDAANQTRIYIEEEDAA